MAKTDALPEATRQWIKDLILRTQRNDAVREVRRQAIAQWILWCRTGDPQWTLPGYLTPPADGGKGYPAGWSYESFRRCSAVDRIRLGKADRLKIFP